MKIKLLAGLLLLVLTVGTIQAIIVATIDKQVTLTFTPGIDESGLQAHNAVTTYNQIKTYTDSGVLVLEELKINETGEISKGVLQFNEKEYSIKDFFANLSADNVIVSNSYYDFEFSRVEINENGFLRISVKDNDTIREFIYENISVGYFILNESGLIEEANIIVGKNNSAYSFLNSESVIVNFNTQIVYRNGTMEVYSSDKNILYGGFNITLNSFFADFSENKITCEDCIVDGIQLVGLDTGKFGVLSFSDKGYLIEVGKAVYKQNLLTISNSTVLIANTDADLSGYDGNWIKQTSNSLDIQSSESGNIDLEILEGHEILNTDRKDKLSLNIQWGDGIVIEKRIDEGLIPKLVHKKSEKGETFIWNDGIGIDLEKDVLKIDTSLWKIRPLRLEKYQSVAFDLEYDSESSDKQKLRINSYSQFVLLSGEDKELVSYNKQGLPVSAFIQDNLLQTLDQLREKYPEMKFEVQEKAFGDFNFFDERDIPPYFLYLTDNFLKDNPDSAKEIDIIEYADISKAYNERNPILGDQKKIVLGIKLDPYKIEALSVTGITSPLQLITHEYEHLKDDIVSEEEFLYFPDAPSSTTLRSKYNQIAKSTERILSGDSEFKRSVQDLYLDIENTYVRDKLDSIISRRYDKDIFSYIKDDLGSADFGLKTSAEVFIEYEQNPVYFNELITAELLPLYAQSSEGMSVEQSELIDLEEIQSFNQLVNGMVSNWKNEDLNRYVTTIPVQISLRSRAADMNKILQTHSGISYAYSLRDYGGVFSDEYSEVSSTYREQTVEQRRALVQSGNRLISENYRKLTQLAFDSGKMPVEEYKAVMGEGYCTEPDCSDKLCIEYKLMCCWENSLSSPNCN